MKKYLFLFTLILCTYITTSIIYADTTCDTDNDCFQSINENQILLLEKLTSIDTSLTNLNTYISVDEENPITLISTTETDNFDTNMSYLLNVYGVFFGLTLFGLFFLIAITINSRT